MRKPLRVAEKLACTLRFLATGESYSSLQYQFRISKWSISLFIPQVWCWKRHIYHFQIRKKSGSKYLMISIKVGSFPIQSDAWMGSILRYLTLRTVALYKRFYSVVLLALVKHNYQLLYVNVGCQGRLSDGAVFKNSDLYRGIVSNTVNIPNPRALPKTGDPCWDENEYPKLPFLIVGDDAFQLSTHMIKPYSGRSLSDEQIVFNYRLS